uniref:Uncharacterized protein n=1 Tax=Pararge aegeria TaxID=116150 RepID=S4PTQ4_9NEOP
MKNARRQHEGVRESADNEAAGSKSCVSVDEELSDADEPPTLCDLRYDDKWREPCASSDCASDDNSAHGAPERLQPARDLKELLSAPNTELDYQTVHSLMFHWLQT